MEIDWRDLGLVVNLVRNFVEIGIDFFCERAIELVIWFVLDQAQTL